MKKTVIKNQENIRIYHFGNMYMSSIQQGIQAAHCQTELALKYDDHVIGVEDQRRQWKNWAKNHKTMILLNAGYDKRLQEIKSAFNTKNNPYPWSFFHESKDAMGGMLTNVAIIIPERIYEIAASFKRKKVHINKDNGEVTTGTETIRYELIDKLTNFEIQLIEICNSCGLAK